MLTKRSQHSNSYMHSNSYIADVGWWLLGELLTRNLFFPALLPKARVYGHYVTLGCEHVFAPGLVQRVVFIEELEKGNMNQRAAADIFF